MIDAFSSATQLAAAIRARKISCRELIAFQVERVSRFNPALNAIISTNFERAVARATEADNALARGESWGPFHGVPITIPETLGGSLPVADDKGSRRVPRLTDGLFASGANVFGESNAQGAEGHRTTARTAARNPWDVARTAGRVSGGAASALAAGLTALEAGGGEAESVGTPAHYCGLYSHRPTYGLLPDDQYGTKRRGSVGPMARSAYDLGTTVALMAGPSDPEGGSQFAKLFRQKMQRLSDYRVAVVLESSEATVDTAVKSQITKAIEIAAVCGTKIDYEERLPFRSTLVEPSLSTDGDEGQQEWRTFFEDYDLLICPAAANVAPYAESITQFAPHEEDEFGQGPWADLSALIHLPITVAPVGLTSGGLPVGMQIIGPQYGDLTCIEFARMLEDRGLSFESPPGY